MGCSLKRGVAQELIVAYAARTLDPDVEAEFERHWETCAGCREAAAQQRAVWTLLEEWQPLPVSSDFDRKLADRIAHSEATHPIGRLFASWSWRPLIPISAACAVLVFAFWLKDDDSTGAPAPANQPTVEIEQRVEHALDDMDMLKQIGVDVSSAKPHSTRKI